MGPLSLSEWEKIPKSLFSLTKTSLLLFQNYIIDLGVFLLLTSVIANFTLKQDLFLEKACRVDLGYDSNVCSTVKNISEEYKDEEVEIQKLMSRVNFAFSFLNYGGPIVLMIVVGPLSDIYGWKIPLIMASLGNFLQHIALILSVYFENWSVWFSSGLQALFRAVGGGEVFYMMAATTYIASFTDEKNRVIRMGIYYAFFVGGVPIGSYFGTKLSSIDMNMMYLIGIATIPSLIGLILVTIFVKNKKNEELAANVNEKKGVEKVVSLLSRDRNFFKVLNTIFRPRECNKRFKIIFLIFSHFCIQAPLSSEASFMYIFLRLRIGWEIEEFGNFYTYTYSIMIFGIIFAALVFKYWLKLHEAITGMISGIGQFASAIIYAFTSTGFLRYFGATLDMFNNTMLVCNKSLLASIVDQNELADLFAFVGLAESLSPFVLVPIYSLVYEATVDYKYFSGTIYLISAALTIPAFIIYGVFIYERIKTDDPDPDDIGPKKKTSKNFNFKINNSEMEYYLNF